MQKDVIVRNDFLPPSLISTSLAWGTPQLFSSSYPPAMHANFGAWLRVKSTILGPIVFEVFVKKINLLDRLYRC